jgi:nitrogen fixation protein NifB
VISQNYKETDMPIIAVASSDGVSINEHFGQAKHFLIFDVKKDGTYQEQERREILPYVGGTEASHSHDGTVAQLGGVDVVLALQVGPVAAESLQSKGIKAFSVKWLIDKSLTSYGKRHKLLEQALPGVSHRCGSGGGCGGGRGRGGCR